MIVFAITAFFQSRFRHTHDIIAGHHFLTAEVAQGKNTAAVFHQRFRPLGHGDQTVGAGVQGDLPYIARGFMESTNPEVIFVSVGDRMHQKIDFVVFLGDLLKHPVQILIIGDVTGVRLGGFVPHFLEPVAKPTFVFLRGIMTEDDLGSGGK